jgi:hypothetical protein
MVPGPFHCKCLAVIFAGMMQVHSPMGGWEKRQSTTSSLAAMLPFPNISRASRFLNESWLRNIDCQSAENSFHNLSGKAQFPYFFAKVLEVSTGSNDSFA